jgi:hypothetical protein
LPRRLNPSHPSSQTAMTRSSQNCARASARRLDRVGVPICRFRCASTTRLRGCRGSSCPPNSALKREEILASIAAGGAGLLVVAAMNVKISHL